jgi:serine/threonine protein kinase
VVSSELPVVPGGLAPGSHVAGYRIEEQIGRGGMAVVYRASDVRLNRPVALKILAPELASDAAFRQRFIREMRSAAAVDHPNIVPVFDAGEADGSLYIAMRYVSGQDVRSLLDTEHRLPPARAVHLITQVASALDNAHARGLVHRDVKPGNMLISAVPGSGQPDHAYLSDFGLSKEALSSSLTLTGQFLGTLDYMAPEQVEGHPIDGRADLYALACTAFEMLAGSPPFKRDAGLAVLWAQLSAPAPSLTALRPDLPPAVDRVLARALAKSPDDRYPSCAEFAAALRAACGLGTESEPGARFGAGAAPARLPTQRAHVAEPHPPEPHPATSWPDDPPTDPGLRPATSWPEDEDPPTDPQLRRAASWAPAPQQSQQQNQAASWPPAPPPVTPAAYQARRPPQRRRSGRRAAAVVIGCIVILAIAGAAYALLRGGASPRRPATAASPARSASTAPAGPLGPAATVQAYVAAINDHDYAKAWDLGGKNTGSSYNSFVSGFSNTAQDNLTVVSVNGNAVTVKLAAAQTNGSVNDFHGTYTVNDGVITQSRIQSGG